MELTVLGSYGPFPKAGGAASSYLISDNNIHVALDFGSGAASRLLSRIGDLDNLAAIVLSHTHLDHMGDLFSLVYTNPKQKIKVYCPFAVNPALDLLRMFPCFEIIQIDQDYTIYIGDMKFTFASMPHPIESYAMKITSGEKIFVYSGDTIYNDSLTELIKGADLAVLDCGRTPLNPKSPHMTLEEAEKIAQEANTTVIASHLYPPYNYVSPSKRVLIAEEIKTYKI